MTPGVFVQGDKANAATGAQLLAKMSEILEAHLPE